LLSIREAALGFELVTVVAAPAAIVNIPSALVSSRNTLREGGDPVETYTVAVDEVECTILLSAIVLAFRRIHKMHRASGRYHKTHCVLGVFAVFAANYQPSAWRWLRKSWATDNRNYLPI
jgi:hypothetical protein